MHSVHIDKEAAIFIPIGGRGKNSKNRKQIKYQMPNTIPTILLAAVDAIKCPICGASPVTNETCPSLCGSLEGVPPGSSPFGLAPSSRLFGYDWARGFVAPFVAVDIHAAADALRAARVGRGDHLVDLGCGDGRICRLACRLGARATGYDLDEALIERAKHWTELTDTIASSNGAGVGASIGPGVDIGINITAASSPCFSVQDLFHVDLKPFSVICVFLLPETSQKSSLVNKFSEALKRNCRIVSFGWEIPPLGQPSEKFKPDEEDTNAYSLVKRWYVYDSTISTELSAVIIPG